MSQSKQGSILAVTALAIILVIVGYYVMHQQETRTAGQKVGDAVNELQKGADKAAQQLEDRTPIEKLEDTTKNVGEDIEDATKK